MKGLVYVVDEYHINLFILNEYMKNDYEVVTFKCSSDCLVAMEERKPDTLLMDCNILSDLACVVKRKYAHVKMLGITTMTDDESDSSIEYADHILIKPIVKSELMKCLS